MEKGDKGGMHGRELAITRVFDAPRELVWKAWTDPDIAKKWWGPKGFTTPSCRMDPRPGGKYLNCMRGPDGKDVWSTGTYAEVVPPSRLVMSDSFSDENGNPVPASHYGFKGDFPMELRITVTFEEQGGRTKMTLRHEGMPAGEHSRGAMKGWNEMFDKLSATLPGPAAVRGNAKREVIISRVFDAPRELVWKAWTDPAMLKRWWGPRGVTNPTCEWDARPGGKIYIVMLAGKELGPAEGMEWPMKGTIKEVVPLSRLVFVGGAMDDVDRGSDTFLEHEVTVDLEDLGGRTKMTVRIAVIKTVGEKAAMALQGMEMGWNQQTDKLGEMLKGMG
jgi:uncharacterized protein YndB with AHSA1/START domain